MIKGSPHLRIFLIACAAVLVHGYHLGADDSAIYIPAIKKIADPALYPFGSQFFATQTRYSLFLDLAGVATRLTHLPVDLVIFLCHILSIYLMLLATWRLGTIAFESVEAHWGGVALIAATLSVPVAGTALVIMDPYLTPRSLSTPTAMFALAAYLAGRPKTALAWVLCTAAIHPQMSVYVIVCIALIELTERFRAVRSAAFGLLPAAFTFDIPQGPAREALFDRTYFFVNNWAWYEWVGVAAPLALLAWFSTVHPRGTLPAFQRISRVLVLFGLLATGAGFLLLASPRFGNFTRLQPMRAFHPLYAIFFALVGGLMGEYLLRRKPWRWAALFVPMAAGMWFAQASAYPYSAHVEWPGWPDGASPDDNSWTNAFYWIRGHTPKDAVFALGPVYMGIPEEDQHGFRAVAERSVLSDEWKDSGVVALFPSLAEEWKRQVQAQTGWDKFQRQDYERLARRYPVTWIVTRTPGPDFEDCPYRNKDVVVCRLPPLER